MIVTNITENIDKQDLEHFLKTFEKILANLKNKSEFLKPLPVTEFEPKDKVSIVEIKGTPIIQEYFASHGVNQYTVLEIKKSKEI